VSLTSISQKAAIEISYVLSVETVCSADMLVLAYDNIPCHS